MAKNISIAGTVLVAGVWAAAGHSTTSQFTQPVHETVVYSTIQPANLDLYVFDSPGATPRRLTTDPGLDYSPAFSPDGRWIVFTSERNGSPDLYALDLQNPAETRQLTKSPAMEDAAAFSPDGRRLLFVSTENGNPDISVMPFAPEAVDAAAGKAENLTRHPAGDYQPAFSPDGQWIAFSSNRDTPGTQAASTGVAGTYQASDVYVMRADGTGVQRRPATKAGMGRQPGRRMDRPLFSIRNRMASHGSFESTEMAPHLRQSAPRVKQRSHRRSRPTVV